MPRSRPSTMRESEILHQFIEEGLQLLEHPLWRDDYRPKFSVKMSVDAPMTTDTHEPPRETVESFLLRLRPLLSEGEPLYVNRARNIARRYATEDSVRLRLDDQLEEWKKKLAGGGIKVTNLGEQLLPEQAWTSFINGYYFHRNEEHRERLLTLADPMAAIHRYQFLQHVFDAAIYINNVAAIAQESLDSGLMVLPQ